MKVCLNILQSLKSVWGMLRRVTKSLRLLLFTKSHNHIPPIYPTMIPSPNVICCLGFFFCVRYFYLSSVLQSYFFFFHFLFPNIFCSSTSDFISSSAGLDLDPKRGRSRHQAWWASYSHGGRRQPGETSFGI